MEKNPEGMIAVLEPLHAKLEEVKLFCIITPRIVIHPFCVCYRARKLLAKHCLHKSLGVNWLKPGNSATDIV